MSSLTDPVSHGRDNSVGGQPTTAQLERAAELVQRRKAAQAQIQAAVTDGRDSHDAESELNQFTEQLLEALSQFPPVIRRLTHDHDHDEVMALVNVEPVHPTSDPVDIARRVADDRRVYVLEHPLLPKQILTVLWVALTTNIPRRIHEVIGSSLPVIDPKFADTAVFYSIWNVDPALSGLDSATQLIAGAVDELRAEFEHVQTFITLSPIPGFRMWYEFQHGPAGDSTPSTGQSAVESNSNVPEDVWEECVRYLCTFDDTGRLLDPVARFHLGNGARLYLLTTDADRSTRGFERSFGLMANYRYEPEDRKANLKELHAGTVPVGPGIQLVDEDQSP